MYINEVPRRVKNDPGDVVFSDTIYGRVFAVSQPGGGYIDPQDLSVTKLHTEKPIKKHSGFPSTLLGLSSTYWFRLIFLKIPKEKVFLIAKKTVDDWNDDPEISFTFDMKKKFERNMELISDLDDDSSVRAVIRNVGYNSWYWNTESIEESLNISDDTVSHVRDLVFRTIEFGKAFSISRDGTTMDFSKVKAKYVFISDVDKFFLSEDTFWFIKVLGNGWKFTKNDTLILLVHYLFGLRTGDDGFKKVKTLGIFNPETNTTYTIELDLISKQVLEEVEDKVIAFI